MIRRRAADMEREELFKANAGVPDEQGLPVTLSTIDWEKRYAELVEDVGRRTDQAAGEKK